MKCFVAQCRSVQFWKADIDAAYRRVPIQPDHRWAAGVAFKHRGVIYTSTHFAFPFGAKSAVHAWDRVGALLTSIARRIPHIPVLRFVGDFFSAAPEKCAQHSMQTETYTFSKQSYFPVLQDVDSVWASSRFDQGIDGCWTIV